MYNYVESAVLNSPFAVLSTQCLFKHTGELPVVYGLARKNMLLTFGFESVSVALKC